MVDPQIEQVKNRTDIVTFISNYVTLKKAGRNYKGLCPFHGEKTASFMVSPDRQIFKCFGCSEGGDVISFYQKIEAIDFGEALTRLAAKAGIELKDQRTKTVDTEKENLKEINQKAADFYHFVLTKHASGRKALEYLKGRGLTDKTIKDWQLGYAPDSWDNLAKFLNKKSIKQTEAIKSGLVLPSQRQGVYDRFRKRIIFPIKSISGEVLAFSGRIFGDGEPKYLNSPDSPIFNKSNNLFGIDLAKAEIKKADQAVLVEGNLDVISSYQAGVRNVVAPLGTALTENQLSIIKRFSTNIVISFDQDKSGVAAARRAIDMAESFGMNIRVANFSEKDPDDLIRKNPNQWKTVVSQATPIYDYIIDKAVKFFGTSSPEAIRKITNEVAPVLNKIENEITSSHYERLLAKLLNVSEESVAQELKKRKSGKVSAAPTQPIIDNKLSDRDVLESYLLALILQTRLISKELNDQDFSNKKYSKLFQLIEKRNSSKLELKEIQELLPEELVEEFDKVTLLALPSELVQSESKIEREIETCTRRLKELNLRARLKDLTLSIKQAEISKQNDKLEMLEKEFNQLSKNLTILTKEK
jgi:DNA primase